MIRGARILKFMPCKYSECVKVSNKKFTTCENIIVVTPINRYFSNLIFLIKSTKELPIIPKIPPIAKYNKTGCGAGLQ